MRLPSAVLTLLVATLVTVAPVKAQQGLTNADIIKMQSAGLSENIILASVNGQPAAYDTSTDDICSNRQSIRLLRSGALCELGAFTPVPPEAH